MKIEIDTQKVAQFFKAFHYKSSAFGRALVFLAFFASGFFIAPIFLHLTASTFNITDLSKGGPVIIVYIIWPLVCDIAGLIVALNGVDM